MSNRQDTQDLSSPFSAPKVTPTPRFPTAAFSGEQGLPETSTEDLALSGCCQPSHSESKPSSAKDKPITL